MFERMILFSFVLLSVLELSYGNDQFNENRDWSRCLYLQYLFSWTKFYRQLRVDQLIFNREQTLPNFLEAIWEKWSTVE